ncbi:dihydrofolate reductase [Sphingobium amiense]|uniref:Dihydrofolate reductase n=1 Tax=Sphingobium amiense TaxID=135719 RepID=A0A494W2H4_9SPHN|nr:NAD(P)-dependent oxidoreductase [Sphingobium amiense]BBD96787.1 dihydrofolate reductase [Sphingobium amiense]
MTGRRLASLWGEPFDTALRDALPDVDLVPVSGTLADVPAGISMLAAAPFKRVDGRFPPRPDGWPFDLRWVQLMTVGFDLYPDWMFDGPVVTSARGTSAVGLAEFALAAILAAAKRIPDIWIDSPDQWVAAPLDILNGRTLGIFGFGAVGQRLAPIAVALGMNVLAVRRSDQPIAQPGVVRAASVQELFERSDHLVLAAPGTSATARLVNADLLATAKPGLHLINIARGTLIDNDALLQALDEGRLSRASLDVTSPEPLPPGHPYYRHPRVYLSPHTAAYTPDTVGNIAAQLARNMDLFERGAPLENIVDLDRGY